MSAAMSFVSTSRRWTSNALRRINYNLSRSGNIFQNEARTFSISMNNNLRMFPNETQTQSRHLCTKSKIDPHKAMLKIHHPSEFDKKVLVLNKTFPSVEEVPDEVSHAQILRARDWLRIRVNIGMGIATVVACVFVAYFGKKAAREGQSISKQNFEMHRKYQEAAAAKKQS